MASTSVSVIIPTYNRPDSLRRMLDSLSHQTYPQERIQVIVVDDGSTDAPDDIPHQSYPFNFVYHRQENSGEVVARNAGAKLSTGQILVFLDDDIEVVPEYLASLVQAHVLHPSSIVLGAIVPIVSPDQSLFQRVYSRVTATSLVSGGGIVPISFTECMSGVLSVTRDGFFEIGQMQPLGAGGRNIWGGIDFAYRGFECGYGFWRALDAVAYHHDQGIVSLRTYCARIYKACESVGLLFAKYPGLVGQIPMFRDKSPIVWREDPIGLIGQKMLRTVVSSDVVQRGVGALIVALEHIGPQAWLLERFYHWSVSANIRAGYRAGLRLYAQASGGTR